MKQTVTSGSALAIAAITLALAGAVQPAKAAPGRVQCLGANSCAGKSDCHTPKNGCKGQNSCKGKGWIHVESEKACADAGGTVRD